ncbi:MAG: FHA domain-containing protein, partial [Planctomycetales bacterium]
ATVGRLATRNLQERMAERGDPPGLPLDEIFSYLRPITEAVHFLNSATHEVDGRRVSLMHQNIQPHTVLFPEEGETVRLGGFRYVRLLEGDRRPVANEDWIPRHLFTAPEVFRGELTRWSDQYSLAMLYMHLRLGMPPWINSDPSLGALREEQAHRVRRVNDLPRGERSVVARAAAPEPRRRYSTCLGFLHELEKACRIPPPVRQVPTASSPARVKPPAAPPRDVVNDKPADVSAESDNVLDDIEVDEYGSSIWVDWQGQGPFTPGAGSRAENVGWSPPVATSLDASPSDGTSSTGSWEPQGSSPESSSAPPGAADDARFTVYRPHAIQPRRWHAMLVFAHTSDLPEGVLPSPRNPLEQVREVAVKRFGAELRKYRNTTQECLVDVPREGTLTLVPDVPGVQFRPPRRAFIWHQDVHCEEFLVTAAEDMDGRTAEGRLSVFLGGVLIAEVPLNVKIDRDADELAPAECEVGRRFRRIFASCSLQDQDVVNQLAKYADAMGDEFLVACADLRSRKDGGEKLKELISQADVFQLFWSTNSMRAPYVRQEWEHALSLNRPGFVRAVYWESPLPEDPPSGLPPEQLRKLRFQAIHKPRVDGELLIIQEDQTERKFKLNLPLMIGNGRGVDISIPQSRVNPSHCLLYELEGAVVVRDENTALGTFVNDQRIDLAVLKPGDKLTVGPVSFVTVYKHFGEFPTLPEKTPHVIRPEPPAVPVLEAQLSPPRQAVPRRRMIDNLPPGEGPTTKESGKQTLRGARAKPFMINVPAAAAPSPPPAVSEPDDLSDNALDDDLADGVVDEYGSSIWAGWGDQLNSNQFDNPEAPPTGDEGRQPSSRPSSRGQRTVPNSPSAKQDALIRDTAAPPEPENVSPSVRDQSVSETRENPALSGETFVPPSPREQPPIKQEPQGGDPLMQWGVVVVVLLAAIFACLLTMLAMNYGFFR